MGEGSSAVIVAGGKVYAVGWGGNQDHVQCLDPATGKPVAGFWIEGNGDIATIAAASRKAKEALTDVEWIDGTWQKAYTLSDGTALSNRLLASATDAGRALNVRMRMRGFDAVCRMVAAGLGVGVLPLEAIAARPLG